MKALVERIQAEAVYLDGGIVKVDGFINHQIDPVLTMAMGQEFAQHFLGAGVTKIVSICNSLISPFFFSALLTLPVNKMSRLNNVTATIIAPIAKMVM